MLRRLGHIDGEDVVQLKGRAACELDTADELLATELMFNGVFQGLDRHHLVALVSCLVPVENTKSEVRGAAAVLAGQIHSLRAAWAVVVNTLPRVHVRRCRDGGWSAA